MSGVSAILAKSFARIFFRNAINIGLPVMECDTDNLSEGDELLIKPAEGLIKNITSGEEIKAAPLMAEMLDILNAGGLKEYVMKNK
jgi:3-isopropylmalate/(R)-2-methylmalate dehydratase small subunit